MKIVGLPAILYWPLPISEPCRCVPRLQRHSNLALRQQAGSLTCPEPKTSGYSTTPR